MLKILKGFNISYIKEILFVSRIDNIKESEPQIQEYQDTLYGVDIIPYYCPPIYEDLPLERERIEELVNQTLTNLYPKYYFNHLFLVDSSRKAVSCQTTGLLIPDSPVQTYLPQIKFIKKQHGWFLAIENSYLEYLRTIFN